MKSKKGFSKRFMSLALSAAMTLGLVPAVSFAVGATDAKLTADTSTYSSYQEFFHIGSGQTLSTENAGAVWTDKSVMTKDNRPDTTVNMEEDSFLVALSAMGSNMTIVGESDIPTDTILVLDISGSMNNDQGHNDVAEDLVDAANATIEELLGMNSSSRIGVALYSGTSSSSTNENASRVILPLDRYTTTDRNGRYLTYTEYWGDEYVGVDSDVRNSNGDVPTSQSIEVVGATYIQKGVLSAIQQLTASSNTTNTNRKPIVVLMSDGAPTLGTSSYANPGQYNLGNGSTPSAALAFVTQLTLSYAKYLIKSKYNTEPLFYTLGLGVDNNALAMSVLNPTSVNASTAVNDFWTTWNSTAVGGSVTVQAATSGWNPNPAVRVTKMDGLTKDYVDGYYTAAVSSTGGNSLTDAFADIVAEIQLQTKYYPTLVGSSEDVSGYVSFVDRIGKYMKVTDIKGIYLGGVLHTGATFAADLENGTFGSAANPTTAGDELVWAVQNRIGVDADTARTLLGSAYTDGQLSYTSDTEYSNYIGWFADANGNFLDYWNGTPGEKIDGATFRVKCYGFYGQVGVDDGTAETDMMYIIVQLRENIATGEQMMTFAVPAALLPIISYNVSLDEDGNVESLATSGATKPIRLVYEVSLDEEITEYTINDKVDSAYILANTNSDGSVSFYSNQYEVDNSIGYGKVNTYSYFNPSKQNNRYYFTGDTLVYANTSGTLATGASPSSGYSRKAVYTNSTVTYHYHEIHSSVLDSAQQNADGTWYIPAGYVHVHTGIEDIVSKTSNETGTLPWTEVPYVDSEGHSLNEAGYDYVVGAILGNNGKLTVKPQTGIKITKTMAAGVATPSTAFEFEITGAADGTYEAYHIDANGLETKTSVIFTNNKTTVELKADETLYIGDMVANWVITVTEIETEGYIADDATKTAILEANEIAEVSFVNSERKTGNITIGKEINHPFGTSYEIPAKTFTMLVTLSGTDVADKTFNASQTKDNTVSAVYVDSNGQFTVTLSHGDQFEIFDLPEGTKVTVVETTPGAGFNAYYFDNGELGDGIIEVRASNTSSVIVVNDYAPGKVDPVNLVVNGTKNLLDSKGASAAWKTNYEFTFVIERFNDTLNAWENAGTDTVTYNDTEKTFSFNLENEIFDKAGVYSYQIKEVKPNDPVDGMYYDVTVHTFSVTVEDKDMDGRLEITKVHSDHADKEFSQVNGTWVVDISFTNIIYDRTPAVVEIPIQKELINNSGSDRVGYAGYEFGLYADENCTVPVSVGGLLTAMNNDHTDAIGEGFIDLVFNHAENATYPQTFTYYVKEKQTGISGMIYSPDVVKVIIEINDTDDSENISLEASVSYESVVNADGVFQNNDGDLVFTNTYEPIGTEFEMVFVNKVLDGKALEAGEFHFMATEYDSDLIATGRVLYGTNDASGNVTFYTDNTYTIPGSFSYDTVGTFAYAITEVDEQKIGYSYDKTTYRVIVTVVDNKGALSATYSVANAAGNEVVFYNTYAPVETTYTISGTKTLTGRVLLNSEFTFVLTDEFGNIYEVENGSANGGNTATFTFPEFTYTAPGVHYYTVAEEATSGASFGITYSTVVYNIAVEVEDVNGQLKATATYYVGGNKVDDLQFINTYTAASTNIQIPGDKELTGKVISDYDGDFTFNLYKSDSAYNNQSLIDSKTNDSSGGFTFDLIGYDTAGSYYYIVDEVNGGMMIDGVKYDETVYHIRVDVVDNYLGQLVATIHVYDSNGIPQDGVVFHNIYGISDDASASISIEGKKTYTYGGTPKSFEYGAFEFDLYQTGDTFDVSGVTPKTTSTSSALNGDFSFAFEYGKDDVTNTSGTKYYYVLKEKNGGTTNEGITYDGTEYHIVVTLSDDGEGGIATDVKYYEATSSGDVLISSIDFANTYSVEGNVSVSIGGNKDYDKSFATGDFKVEISGVTAPVSISEDKTWSYTFNYDNTDIGTYEYIVKEVNAGDTINGITYDSKTYTITVVVEDDGKGGITATASEASGTAIDNLNFANFYAVKGNVNVTLSGTKTLTGKVLEAGKFNFKIYETDSTFTNEVANGYSKTEAYTVNGQGIGEFKFELAYDETDIGNTYYYVIEEEAGTLGGISYDTTKYKVTVKVEDDGNGKVKVSVKVGDGEFTSKVNEDIALSGVDFKNEYSVNGNISITLSGDKIYNIPFSDNFFTFELYNTDSNYVTENVTPITTQNVNGAYSFVLDFSNITLDEIGNIKYYVIKEAAAQSNLITTDTNEYRVSVEFIDGEDGTVTVEIFVQKFASDGTALDNGYTVTDNKDVTISDLDFTNTFSGSYVIYLEGQKFIDKTFEPGDFTFELYPANDKYEITGDAFITTENEDDGLYGMSIVCTAEDVGQTYYFVLKEKNAGQKINGIVYDINEYKIKIEVHGNNDFIDAAVWVEDSNGKTDFDGQGGFSGQNVLGLNFTNEYQPIPTSTVISGVKELWGRKLILNEFKFRLYTADSNFTIIQQIAPITAYNSENGSFDFGEISLTEAKTYYFVIMEDTSMPKARVTYDRSVYFVSIDVADDGTGQLVAADPVITKGNTKNLVDEITFVNYYIPAPSPVVTSILARKTVTNVGTATIGPEGFDFVLYNVTQGKSYRATSGADGLATFNLVFSEADIGKTYVYKMYEVNDGRINVEYSRVEYTITVYVYRGVGNTINTSVTLNGAQVSIAVADFENVYDYTPYIPDLPDVPDDPEDPDDPDDPIIPDVPVDPPVNPEDPDDPVNPGTTDGLSFAMIVLGFIFGFLSIALFKKKKV